MMTDRDYDRIYVLNPCYRLRSDEHRAILYTKDEGLGDCSHDWCSAIHPFQAVMLSFFTQCRTLGENIQALCQFFYHTETTVKDWLCDFIDNPTALTYQSRVGDIRIPKRVLIPLEDVKGDYVFSSINVNDFVWTHLDLETRRLFSGPLQITFMLNNHCTTSCKYCYADTSTQVKYPLTTHRILQLIDEASRIPVRQVDLIGGEVFLHPDWKIILRRLVELDIAPEYISTKLVPTQEWIEALKECGYHGTLQISWDAADDRVLKECIGSPDGYALHMLQGLKQLDKSGLKYQVATTLTRFNGKVEILEDLYKVLSGLKHLSNWRIVPVSYSSTKDEATFQHLRLRRLEALHLLDELEKKLDAKNPFAVILGRAPLEQVYRKTKGGSRCFGGEECSALTSHLFILPDGQVTICEQLYWQPRFLIGNVKRASIRKVWNSEEAHRLFAVRREDISEESACCRCELFDDCFGFQNRCWSNITKAYGSDHWDFPDPRCIFAPKMKHNIGYDEDDETE
jgi:radical SAM protein with 4Fe4S-binding SPASM domain